MSNNIDSFFSELELFGIKLGLEQTNELFTRIGSPHHHLKFIHIAGSNGKGSVGAMLSAALTGVGYKTGFYSSPHLISIRERFRIDGKAIDEIRLKEIINHIGCLVLVSVHTQKLHIVSISGVSNMNASGIPVHQVRRIVKPVSAGC